jgi:hypothetical protein
MNIDYDGRNFHSISNSATGEVSAETIFYYHEKDGLVWAEYSGGGILRGMLLATKDQSGSLDVRYQHVNSRGELMTGTCRSQLEIMPDGHYRLHEKWQWTSGDRSSGESVIEEVQDASSWISWRTNP